MPTCTVETFAPKGVITGPILPTFVLERKISLGAKLLYALLCNYADRRDYCWPSYAKLSKRLACSLNSVKKYMWELVDDKLVSIRKLTYHSSHYYLLLPPELREKIADRKNDSPPDEKADHIPDIHNRTKIDAHLSEFDTHQSKSGCINNSRKHKEENTPPLPPTEVKSLSSTRRQREGGMDFSLVDFEKAWAEYPNKEKYSLARTAWLKLRKSGELPSLPMILDAIERTRAC
jgi:hypothetical protein